MNDSVGVTDSGDPSPEELIWQLLAERTSCLSQGLDERAAECGLEIGNVEVQLQNYESAKDYFLEAREIFGRLGNDDAVGRCHVAIGNVEIQLQNYESAKGYFLEAREIYGRLGMDR